MSLNIVVTGSHRGHRFAQPRLHLLEARAFRSGITYSRYGA